MENISVNELRTLNSIKIIDIRSMEKYNDNHILNAYNITFYKLLIKPEIDLEKGEKYYIYCQKGLQSRQLCNILSKQGYNLVNIIGGYEAWILTE